MTPEIMAQLMATLQSQGVGVSGSGDFARGTASSSNSSDPQGRSREYREASGMQLSGPFAGLAGAGAALTTTSPVVPLKFEQPPGRWQSECAAGQSWSSYC
jgi:hypothetical protein